MKKLFALVLALCLMLSMVSLSTAEGTEVYRFDKPLTLKISVFDRGAPGGTDVSNNFYSKWIQENFGDPRNIKIEWVVIPRSEEEAKLATLITSADTCPDICFTYNTAIVSNYAGLGGLTELSSYIDEYGPTLKEFLGSAILDAGRYNGGQYAIPARRVVVAWMGSFIREDWLEKLGLPMPTTKEEFLNCLREFRDKNPGNVAGGCIPFAMSADMRYIPWYISFIKNFDPKMFATVPQVKWDGYKDFVQFLNTMYNEGLLSPDFQSDTTRELENNAITSGQAGGYHNNYDHPIRVSPGLLAGLRAYEPDAKLSVLNCFESVIDGKYYHLVYNADGLQIFVPSYSDEDHVKAAVMYLDWLSQYDTIYFLQNGIEGETYDLNEDGIPIVKDVTGDKHFNSMQNIDYTLTINGQWLDTEERTIAAQALSYQGFADLYEPMYVAGNENPVQTIYHFEDIIESDAQYNTSLANLQKELLVRCTRCKPEEFSALYDQLVDDYMAQGGQAVMEERIASWDKAHQ
jgi:putative aldouronate transport system substrate-binding protein